VSGNWSDWEQWGQYEFKVSKSGRKIIIRAYGQTTNYPHYTATIDPNTNKVISGHGSVSIRGQSYGTDDLIYTAALMAAYIDRGKY
jgi:hypothetical protein